MTLYSRKRVLVVEDDLLLALMMGDILEELGYMVVGPCYSLEEGLAAASSQSLDFALLDYDLGSNTDSIPIAQALAARGIPFAFATGAHPEQVRCAFAGRPVLSKPVAPSELHSVVG